ncbi:MAG: T9SS type A sorting domain-containing protein [Candidatus Marinimicrobia bacterium]|nr:T9SS type A sorting domain-containing protein [Candidatus Neomarinimicrobiota bacterium]
MKQLLKLSIYSLTLMTVIFSQSLTGNYQVDYINVDYTWVVRPSDASTDTDPILSDPSNPTNAQGGYELTVSWPSSAAAAAGEGFSYPVNTFSPGDTAKTQPVPLWGLLQLSGFPYGWISMNVDFNDDGTFHINDADGDFFNGPGDDPENPIPPPPFYIHGSSYPTTATEDCEFGQVVLPVNEDGSWTSAGTFVDDFRNQLNQGWGINLSGTFAEFHAPDLLNDIPGVDYGQIPLEPGEHIDFTDFPWRDGVSAPHHTPNPSWGAMKVTYNDDFSTVQDFGVSWSATDGPSSNVNVVDPTDDGYTEEEAGYYNGVLGIAELPSDSVSIPGLAYLCATDTTFPGYGLNISVPDNPIALGATGQDLDGNGTMDGTLSAEWGYVFDPSGSDGEFFSGDEPLQFTGYYFTYNFMVAYGTGIDTFTGCAEAYVPGCVVECMTTGGGDQETCTETCTFLSLGECSDDAAAAILTTFGLDEGTANAIGSQAYEATILPCLMDGGEGIDCVLEGLIWSIGAAQMATGGAWMFPDDSDHDFDGANGRLTFQVDNLCLPVLETQDVNARFQNTENFRWLDQAGFMACVMNDAPACVAECMGNGGSQDDCTDYCTGVCLATNGNPGLAQINDGWNLVGLPIETSGLPYLYSLPPPNGDEDPTTFELDLFGDQLAEGTETVPGSLYEFNGAYVPAMAPVAGKGYWMRSNTDPDEGHMAIFQGYSRLTITHTLTEGWNMISGISNVMLLDEITDPDGLIVPGSLYEFNGTYSDAPYIVPGKGYWVRSFGEGDVTFTNGAQDGKLREFKRYTDVNTLSITNRTGLKSMPLYFGLNIENEKEQLSYGLPPAPPQGAFDVRFSNDWRYIENHGNIHIQDDTGALVLSYDILDDSKWILTDSQSQDYVLEGSGTVTLTGDISTLNLRKSGTEILPDVFALSQNFPNPFNPKTTISIDLPENQYTIISVWAMTGQLVETLHNGELNAGTHNFTFNGGNLASGMYFYRVEAGPYQATKKMLLMK